MNRNTDRRQRGKPSDGSHPDSDILFNIKKHLREKHHIPQVEWTPKKENGFCTILHRH